MENLNSCKQKANLKKDLIEYYDQIKFAIDMKVQNLLVNIENSQTVIPDEKDYILKKCVGCYKEPHPKSPPRKVFEEFSFFSASATRASAFCSFSLISGLT